MKAVTVAGGSSDDPEIEAETTVRKAEAEPTDPADALESADPEAGAEAAPEVAPEAAADGTARPEAGTDARPEAGTDARPEAEAGPEAEDAREAETESRDEVRPEAGLSATAVPDAGPGAEHARVAASKPRGEAEPDDEAHSDAKPKDLPEAEASHQPGVDDATAAKAAPDAGTKTQAEPGQSGTGAARKAKAELGASRREAEPEAEADAAAPEAHSGSKADPRTGVGAAREAKAGLGSGRPEGAAPKADAGSRTDAGSEADPRTGVGSAGEAGTGPGARAGVERARETNPEPRGEAERQNEAGPDAAAQAGPGAGTTPHARPRPDVVPEAGAGGDALSQANGRPGGKPGDEARPETEKRTGGKDEARSGAEAKAAPTAPKPKADPRTGAAHEAKTGLGAGRPEGEPAAVTRPAAATPKDHAAPRTDAEPQTRTRAGTTDTPEPKAQTPSGAGAGDTRKPKAGRTEADAGPDAGAKVQTRAAATGTPEAEAGPGAGPNGESGQGGGGDETQVIARPGPSWARKVEPDAERTSQFVALKDLDTPAPAPAAPLAARPAPPAATADPQPQPPLELLADLTNTPPPAETPRRTTLRRVKIWTPILLLLVGAGAGAQLLRPLPAAQLVAAKSDHTAAGQFSIPWPAKGQGAVRVSGSGDLGTFGEQKPVPTASVAKVMTAYVILKNHPLRKTEPGPDITIDAKTVADGTAEHESRIPGLTAGTKFSQQDMLKMLMIPSGNNVARLLARWDSGTDSEAAFVEKMNAAAKELGMTGTTYTDPSGLDARTVSTAADQLKLAEAVMKDETFRSIVALPNATIKGLSQRLENNNILLTAQGLSIRGIKTGSSTPAGGALMWAAYKSIGDETPLILGTLMDQHVDGPDEDGGNSLKLVLANSKTIIEAVRTALASVPVIRKGDVVGHMDDGLGGRTPLVAAKDLNVIGVPGQQLKLSLAPTAGGPLPHTAKDGAEVAVLTVGSGEGAKSVPVAVKGALVEPSFGTRLTRGR
ncbi:serine hydrolase [Streptomyces avidinii]|uniref:serine hydrolase n=1 Tax=Streptomyces avidinii TaxID=1895 RepID=UPI0037B36C4F